MVYSIKHTQASGLPPQTSIICSHANHRGDIIARSSDTGSLTSFALYEAYGTRPTEWSDGVTGDPDRQKANTKEEESDLGLLNEGMRYRDLETGTFLTRDPIGYKDGPNVYCYVHCNPITHFDPLGLRDKTRAERRAADRLQKMIDKTNREVAKIQKQIDSYKDRVKEEDRNQKLLDARESLKNDLSESAKKFQNMKDGWEKSIADVKDGENDPDSLKITSAALTLWDDVQSGRISHEQYNNNKNGTCNRFVADVLQRAGITVAERAYPSSFFKIPRFTIPTASDWLKTTCIIQSMGFHKVNSDSKQAGDIMGIDQIKWEHCGVYLGGGLYVSSSSTTTMGQKHLVDIHAPPTEFKTQYNRKD